MQRVVAVFGIQRDLHVIILTLMLAGNLADLMAEISFDFQDQSANPLCRISCFICDQLLCKRPHTAACFSRANSAEDANAGKQPLLWNRQPLGIAAGSDFGRMMNFANY